MARRGVPSAAADHTSRGSTCDVPAAVASSTGTSASEKPNATLDVDPRPNTITRLVLIHVPARDDLLPRLAAALRPGGILFLEEDDIHPVLATAEGPCREAWQAMLRVTHEAGTDPEWARGLPERLGALGLVDVESELDGQLFPGGSVPAQFWALTWLQARERAVALGIPGEIIDAGRAVIEDPARWFHGPVKVVAWGRRPPHSGDRI